jgi:hypothetical protein
MRILIKYSIVCTLIFFAFISACKKEGTPENPYDAIDRSVNTTTEPDPDPNSIVGLHKNIFSPKCANPGCHDGTFEPDYRTIESTYSTLIYQPVNKTTLDSAKIFTYRAIPHNTADSWLIERLTTSTSEYMPSNGVRLNQTDIDHVKTWINNGCPDANGNLPVKPNLQPNFILFFATDSVLNRIDSIRLDNYILNPFLVQQNQHINFYFLYSDSADGPDATLPSQFISPIIKFSINKNDFTGAATVPAIYYPIGTLEGFLATLPVSWPSGTIVYFRFYVNDGHHGSVASEFPRSQSLDYYKTYFSLYVQ